MNLEYIKSAEDNTDPRVFDSFTAWLEDESYFQDYSNYEFVREELLLRVFKYTPVSSDDIPLFDENGEPLGALEERVLPFAKVIKAGKEAKYFKTGDVVCLTDAVSINTQNPKFLEWKEQEHMRPDNRGKMPPVLVHGLEKFYPMLFIKDKILGIQPEDEVTFLVPEGLARCGYNSKTA